MSYCVNPKCPRPNDQPDLKFCTSCGYPLLLDGRYRVYQSLSEGGFGRTFLAKDERTPTHRRVVVKQLKVDLDEAKRLFRLEAEQLDMLGSHQQIPMLMAWFEERGCQYIVQQYIEGKTLTELLLTSGRPLQEDEVRRLLSEVLTVLDFLHTSKILHRDIKPDNVIVPDDGGKAVLVDFGMAKVVAHTALAQAGTRLGTPGYMAPEQAAGVPVFASDIYSLGMMCLTLLTRTAPERMLHPKLGTVEWRPLLRGNPVTEEFGAVLDKMTALMVKERYRTVPEVIAALESLPPVSSVPPTVPVARSSGGRPIPQAVIQPESSEGGSSASFVHVPSSGAQEASSTPSHSNPDPKLSANSELNTVVVSPGASYRASNDPLPPPAPPKVRFVGSLSGHSEGVLGVCFTPDGRHIVTGGLEGSARVFELPSIFHRNGKVIKEFKANRHIFSVALSPDGQYLACGTDKGEVQLWNFRSRVLVTTLGGYRDRVYKISFAPDSKSFAAASGEGAIRVRAVSNQSVLRVLTGHRQKVYSVRYNPAGTTMVSAGRDGTLRLWDPVTGDAKGVLVGHVGTIFDVAWSPNGVFLASGGQDKAVRIWNARDEELLLTLSGHTDFVYGLAFTPDGNFVVSGSKDGALRIWFAGDGSLVHESREATANIQAVAMNPQGSMVVASTADGGVYCWRLKWPA